MADHTDGRNNGNNIDKPIQVTTEEVAAEHGRPNIFEDASLSSALEMADSDYADYRIAFDDLPPEIIMNIFAMLTLIERTKVELVSTDWQDVIRSIKDQKVLILTNKRTVGPKSKSTIKACNLPSHHRNDLLHKVTISNNDGIIKVLQRCPRLTVLVIDFEPDFVFSQKKLANDLNEFCPLLEHLNWYAKGSKRDFLRELGILKNLSCWSVGTDYVESDEAVNFLARQPKLHLNSLAFGKDVSKVLPTIDPTTIEALSTLGQEIDELVNISRFHQLKTFICYRTTQDNYRHLQSLTTLIQLEVFDTEHIFNASILEEIVKNNKKLTFLHIRLDMDVRGIPLIAKCSANLSLMDIRAEPTYYQDEDWIAMSRMQKLDTLELKGITTSQADMDGMRLVIETCPSLIKFTCRHVQDAHLDEKVILEIQMVICTTVASCQINPPTELFIREVNHDGGGVKECMLTWVRYEDE